MKAKVINALQILIGCLVFVALGCCPTAWL